MSVTFTYRYHHPDYNSRRYRDERYDRREQVEQFSGFYRCLCTLASMHFEYI